MARRPYIHWPRPDGRTCWCTQTFQTVDQLRIHLSQWMIGLTQVQFKREEDDRGRPIWTSLTHTPMHIIRARPDTGLDEGRKYRIWCQCGWEQMIDLPRLGEKHGNNPGRHAVQHIREVVDKILEEAPVS